MKNKEIEELLNYMQYFLDENHKYYKEINLSKIGCKLLLSYIEQLENNRDKAIEEIKYLISNCDIVDYQGKKIINILKGDSDENRNV